MSGQQEQEEPDGLKWFCLLVRRALLSVRQEASPGVKRAMGLVIRGIEIRYELERK